MPARNPFLIFIGCLITLTSAASGRAAEGTIKLKFKLSGAPPKAKVLAAVNPCGAKGPVLDNSLLVGPKNELANVAVYLYVAPGTKPPTSEAALKALAKEHKVDNKNCYFEPRISAMHTGQKLLLGNGDAVGHNVKMETFANGSFNEIIPGGGSLTKEFKKGEKVPSPLACNIHPFMGGFVLVTDTPFFGVSDVAGDVTIKHVPTGKRTFVIWHEKGYITKAKQNGKEIAWAKGRIEIDVKETTDLGEFIVPVELLAK